MERERDREGGREGVVVERAWERERGRLGCPEGFFFSFRKKR